jgi:hypothetical protein
VTARKQALYDLLKDAPDVNLVQEEIVQYMTSEEAQTIMENILSGTPDVAGVFTTGDVFAIGITAGSSGQRIQTRPGYRHQRRRDQSGRGDDQVRLPLLHRRPAGQGP